MVTYRGREEGYDNPHCLLRRHLTLALLRAGVRPNRSKGVAAAAAAAALVVASTAWLARFPCSHTRFVVLSSPIASYPSSSTVRPLPTSNCTTHFSVFVHVCRKRISEEAPCKDGRRTIHHVYHHIPRLVRPDRRTNHTRTNTSLIPNTGAAFVTPLYSFSFIIYLLLSTCIGVQLRRSDIWDAVVHNSRGAKEARARRARERNGRGAGGGGGEEYEMVRGFGDEPFRTGGGGVGTVGRDQWTRKGF